MVSDVFFCLFDQEKWNKNNLNLTFWTNIRSLVTIKKMIKGDTCRFFWKQRNKKKHYEMILTIENSNELVNLMLDKMSKFGINYKVSKHNLEPKQGQIPAIDIETVEKNISECEARLEDNPDIELIQYLMNLYEKVCKLTKNY
jgi:viroplasmin and RNaseH domain-containing protein